MSIALTWLSAPADAAAHDKSLIVIKAEEGFGAAAVRGTGASVESQIGPGVFTVEAPGGTAVAAASALERNRKVEWAEPVVNYRAARIPADPCYSTACGKGGPQRNLTRVDMAQAWGKAVGDPQVKIAVIDSGVDVGHPDLAGRVSVGPNYSTDQTNSDEFGHGTHVTGILAAAQGSTGVVGVNWRSPVTSIKVLDHNGEGENIGVAQAMYWATDNGIRIANLSLTGPYSKVVDDAVAYAQSRGVLVVAAAGNEGKSTAVYPAALDGVIAVGNSTNTDTRGSRTNFGSWVDVFAPGENVLSTWPRNLDAANPYQIDSGTSMAAPLVAGIASLVWEARPYLSAEGVQALLKSTADPFEGGKTYTESGRVDAGQALKATGTGYRFTAADGGVFAFGASFEGSAGAARLASPIVSQVSNGTTDGYWLFSADGGVFSYGSAAFFGSMGGKRINAPIVAAFATRSGHGYWMIGADGAVFSFGDAVFFGSMGGKRLNRPIVAAMATASGRGYWLVASDGGVFSFGDAEFLGSTGSIRLNQPIVGAAPGPQGTGYWLVASDGGVFTFGRGLEFWGSTGSIRLNQPIVAMSPTASGKGYNLVAADGGVFTFGDSEFKGSTGNMRLNQRIVAAANTP